MANLQDLDEELGAWAALRFGLVRRSGHFVKIVLIIGGSVLAGVAHFVTEQHEPSAWHIAGIAASLIVGLVLFFLHSRNTTLLKSLRLPERR